LGSDALRKVAVNERFEIDTAALKAAIAQDREAKFITEITLSYTFHQISLEEAEAALAPASTQPIN
jgi:cytochrome c oxidase assembly protein Cox11